MAGVVFGVDKDDAVDDDNEEEEAGVASAPINRTKQSISRYEKVSLSTTEERSNHNSETGINLVVYRMYCRCNNTQNNKMNYAYFSMANNNSSIDLHNFKVN